MDLLHVKQGLILYLADHDQRVQNTFFSNDLMDDVLPYVCQVSRLWEGLEDRHLLTSHPAISSYYHSLRGHLRNKPSIQLAVSEHLDAMEHEENEEEAFEQESCHQSVIVKKEETPDKLVKPKAPTDDELGFAKNTPKSEGVGQSHTKDIGEDQGQIIPRVKVVSLEESIQFHQWKEYQDLWNKVRVKKRELKALHKEFQVATTKCLASKDPLEDSD